MTKHVLTIGLFDWQAKVQLIPNETAKTIITQRVIDAHMGMTMSECTGVYWHEDENVLVVEPSIRVEIYGPSKAEVLILIDLLKHDLNQQCITYEFTEQADIDFV